MKSKIFKIGTVLFFTLLCNIYLSANNGDDDDTPPDVHYKAGMGCIDCHGSPDMHGGFYYNAAHDPNDVTHKGVLMDYALNNSPESAATSNIDLVKLNMYISNLGN